MMINLGGSVRKGISLGAVLMAVLMLGGVACGGGGAAPTPTEATTQPTPTEATGGTPVGEVIDIQQTELPYSFIPDTFNLELNKTYTLSFGAVQEFHTFTVDDLTIEEVESVDEDTPSVDIFINAGESVQQTITPTKAGTFKLYCVPHEGLGMVGQVIVK